MLIDFIKHHLSVLFDVFYKEDKPPACYQLTLESLGITNSIFSPWYVKPDFTDYTKASLQTKHLVCREYVKSIKDLEYTKDLILLYHWIEYLACHRSGSVLRCLEVVEKHK